MSTPLRPLGAVSPDLRPSGAASQYGVSIMVLWEAMAEETAKMGQIKLTRSSPSYWRVTFDNPPLNLMGPEFVPEIRRSSRPSRPTKSSGSWSSTAPSKCSS